MLLHRTKALSATVRRHSEGSFADRVPPIPGNRKPEPDVFRFGLFYSSPQSTQQGAAAARKL